MKIIKPGKFTTSIITCPYCEAVLEIDARDVGFLTKNSRYVKCGECESVIFIEKNDEDHYYISPLVVSAAKIAKITSIVEHPSK